MRSALDSGKLTRKQVLEMEKLMGMDIELLAGGGTGASGSDSGGGFIAEAEREMTDVMRMLKDIKDKG